MCCDTGILISRTIVTFLSYIFTRHQNTATALIDYSWHGYNKSPSSTKYRKHRYVAILSRISGRKSLVNRTEFRMRKNKIKNMSLSFLLFYKIAKNILLKNLFMVFKKKTNKKTKFIKFSNEDIISLCIFSLCK